MLKVHKSAKHVIIKKPSIPQIRTDTIEKYLGKEDVPLFIAALRKDQDFGEILRQLELISAAYKKERLSVCYILEDLIPYFTDRFGVGGTPTFLVIVSGIVSGTLLGKNSTATLMQFIRDHLLRRKAGTRGIRAQHTVKPGPRKRAAR